MSERQFFLVDAAGTPLDERYQLIAQEIAKRFGRLWYLDPADLDTLLGTTSQKVAAQEQKNGQLRNFRAYFWKTFLNGLAGLFRRTRYRVRRREVDLDLTEHSRAVGICEDLVQVENDIAFSKAFRQLSERDRGVLAAARQGYSAAEIAHTFGTTEGNVNVVLCRARKMAAKFFGSGTGLSR